LSKHRRPTRIQRLGNLASQSPLQLGIAAGVAGTLSVTGTVVATAADSTTVTTKPRSVSPVAAIAQSSADLSSATGQHALQDAVAAAQEQRQADLAKAQARAAAKRAAARKAAAERRAQKRAEARASQARTFSSASRGVERTSASAANALQLAAAAASGAYYVHGGDGPSAFDCSGFTMYVFSKMGISLPHSSSAQRSMVQSVSSPQPGDLVFVYNGGGGSVGHVAIYAGGGYWWEASNPSMGVGKHRAWSSNVSYGRIL
jgi:cell wall-associated NlpC family hydrolase